MIVFSISVIVLGGLAALLLGLTVHEADTVRDIPKESR